MDQPVEKVKVTVVTDALIIELFKVLGTMPYQQVFGVLDKFRSLTFYEESEIKIEKKETPVPTPPKSDQTRSRKT